MAANPNRALNRLMGRLSALRQTLRKDERDLLDSLVLGAPAAEVEAHRMIPQAPEQASRKSATSVAKRVNQRVNMGSEAEVVAHGMVSRIDKKAADAVAKRVNQRVNMGSEAEVVAHSMVSRVDKKAADAVAKRVNQRVNMGAEAEVVAHSMVNRVDKKAADAVAKGVSARINWDAAEKSYRVNGD